MEAGLRRPSVTALLICVAVSHLAGLLGWTLAGPGDRYQALVKPPYNPPGWVFAPVWTLLYTLMGGSLYLVWTSPVSRPPGAGCKIHTGRLVPGGS